MVDKSQNGWSVIARPPSQLIPGTDIKISVRPGDVAIVLLDCAAQINKIESLALTNSTADEWGWAARPIRGQTLVISNHQSATAIDVNATLHPRGVRGTWSKAEIKAIDTMLEARYGGAVRWGEHYSTTVDGMHFEINVGPALLKLVAQKVLKLQAAEYAAAHPVVVPPVTIPALPAPRKDEDMKLAQGYTRDGKNNVVIDPRVFVVGVGVKHPVTSPAVRDAYISMGVDCDRTDPKAPRPYLVGLSLLTGLPDASATNAAVAAVSAQLKALATEAADDATKTQVEDLHELVKTLIPAVPSPTKTGA